MELLWFLIVGIVSGWIAGELVKGHGFGMVGNFVVGIIGALIGGNLFALFGVSVYGIFGSIAMSVVGAVIFLWIMQLAYRQRHV